MKITVPLLNLECLKTMSSIQEIRNATVLSELFKLRERSKCSECQLKLVARESGIEHDDYLQPLFCGGTPSIALHQTEPPEVLRKKKHL